MMEVKGWRYYNHAVIPTTLPHEEVDITPIESGAVWKEYPKAILARWTSDFDCQNETDWWYVIRDGIYCVDDFSQHQRKHIRQALKKCYVKRINAPEMIDDVLRVHLEAIARYQNYDKNIDKDKFIASVKEVDENVEWWGVFLAESDLLVGYMKIRIKGIVADIAVSKFSSLYLNSRMSDALYHTVLDHYLNERKLRYVNSGEKSISHITNTQDYKVSEFHYRKAYCKLNIAYNPKYKPLIKLMYPFRKLLGKFSKVSIVDKVLSILRMEEIVRKERNTNE